jgi:hypothetical protein
MQIVKKKVKVGEARTKAGVQGPGAAKPDRIGDREKKAALKS